MSKIAALKKKAAELEQKKQFDKALALYVQVLEEEEASDAEEPDIGLYNRVGDMYLRLGNVGDAVNFYERAVDKYADGGFFNNAIAICTKILRQSPGRTTVYYKLGKISAQKGFKSDAKKNFLEYADRMQQSGNTDEAFRALKEFAELVPDQADDIRLMLADQLSKNDRKDEALEQLQELLDKFTAEGRTAEASATLERMKAINPDATPRASGQTRQRKSTDLVFLPLDDEAPAAPADTEKEAEVERAFDIAPPVELQKPESAFEAEYATPVASQSIPGLEPTHFDHDDPAPEPIDLAPMEPEEPAAPLDLMGVEDTSAQDTLAGLPMLDSSIAGSPSAELPFIMPDEPADANALSGLPMMDVGDDTASGGVDIPLLDLGSSAEAEPIELDMGVDTPVESGADLPPAPSEPTPLSVSVVGGTDQSIELPGAPVSRKSTSILARSVDGLRVSVELKPDDWVLRRQLGEALLEDGEKERGLAELDAAMVGFEKSNDLENAREIADEIVKVNADSVRHLQKRVEYAFRASDRSRLAQCYVELADALLRAEQTDKARAVYQRVLELSPDDIRAQAALASLPEAAAPEPEPPQRTGTTGVMKRPSVTSVPNEPAPVAAAAPSKGSDDDFVDLGEWLRDDDGPKDTRMVVAEEEPTGDEQADFADMLKKFKAGVAENVDVEDHESHYDLGVAYKEMGLLDEAISEFQIALRGTGNRVRTYEALGQCFMEKGQPQIASTILGRAMSEKGLDDSQLIGVLYLLGQAAEELKKPADALEYYNRVFAIDIQFRDVGERLNSLEKVAQ